MNSKYAEYLKSIEVIIWDEISMISKHVFECVDRLFKDLCYNNKPFGDKIIIAAGDFRQTLPIIKHGSRNKIINSCVKRSLL